MSNIKALITALVLGSSSVAMADTNVSFHGDASPGTPSAAPIVRDRFAHGMWISLGEPMELVRGRNLIKLDSRTPMNQLRIQVASGSSYISTVTVRFEDGTRQQVVLNRWIDGRNPTLQFNLDRGGRIDRLVINGSMSRRGGSYQVFGYGKAEYARPTVPGRPHGQRW